MDFITGKAEFFHIIKDITNIEGLGWQLRGNILGLNFQLYDADGGIIAVIFGILAALRQRLKEIESGEEEEARKY